MTKQFSRPIPGQSLVRRAGNAPYERPPQIVDPEQALYAHLDRLNDPDRMEAVVDLLDQGFDVKTMTEGLLRNAVMNGIHNIDVSLLIQKPIEDFILSTAQALGVEAKTGYEGEDRSDINERVANQKAMRMSGGDVPQPKPRMTAAEPMPTETPAPEKMGLMARK